MHKILLCDDEFFVREMLKQAIDWESAGFTIIGEAETGEETVTLAKQLCPDAILLDINMPLFSGMEALAKIREWNQDVEVIIVTGYNMFEYARQGIRQRVFDYLVKPVDERDLENICKRLSKCLTDRAGVRRFSPLPSVGNMDGALRTLEASLYRCVVLALENDPLEGDSEWQSLDAEHNLSRWIREALGTDCLCFTEQFDLVCVFAADPPLREEALAGLPEQFFKQFGRSISAAYCGFDANSEQLRSAYETTKSALAQRFFGGSRQVFTNPAGNGCHILSSEPQDIPLEQIVMALQLGNVDELANLSGQFFDYLTNQAAALGPNLVKTVCADAVATILKSHYGIKEYSTNLLLKTEIDTEIRSFSSLGEVREWMDGILRSLCVEPDGRGKAKQPYVNLAQAVISENLTNPDLSVAFISRRLYINTSYLSHFFKKEYGMGMSDYISEERMKLAQEILRTECPKIEEIALRVGYKNTDYFGKSFKKRFGVPYSKMKLSYQQRLGSKASQKQ